ncbi:coiled-coil domain-containing protein 63-like isoform 3-T10 [Amazona ochrocephala]
MSLKNKMLEDRNCRETRHLLRIRDRYDSLIRERKALLAVLDNQIEELEKKVAKQNLIATKVKQANSSKQLQKRIDKLEMRLYNASVHFNTIVAKNNKLREEIESLQIRKAVLDNFYCKLHTKLEQQKRRMNTAVEQTTQAYEQWSEAQARIADMSKRHRKDTAQYHIEMQEQERILARETKLKAFMLARFTDRSELEEQAKKERGIRGERICAVGTANQEPAELARGLFIVIYSTAPQRPDLFPFQRLLHPTFTLQVKRMNSGNHAAVCVPLGQREGWGGCPYVQPCLLLSSWGGIPLYLTHCHEDSDFPA